MANIHKLQELKSGEQTRYFLTMPKQLVSALNWKKRDKIKMSLTTQDGAIKLLLEKKGE